MTYTSFHRRRQCLVLPLLLAVLAGGQSAAAQAPAPPAHPPAPAITAVEYFLDADPGFGNGAALPLTPASNAVLAATLPCSALQPGIHRLYCRAKDAAGRWGQTQYRLISVLPDTPVFPASTALPAPLLAEYSIDGDPGPGEGLPLPLSPAGASASLHAAIPVDTLSPGHHTLLFRAQSASGAWSQTVVSRFLIQTINTSVIPPHAPQKELQILEYFFDTDPGFGNGTLLAIPQGTLLQQFSFAADISALQEGVPHTLFARILADGVSLTQAKTFVKGGQPLALQQLSLTAAVRGREIQLQWRTAPAAPVVRFEIERSAEGRHFVLIGSLGATGIESDHAFTDSAPLQGRNIYRLRLLDASGQASYSPAVQAQLQGSEAVRICNPVGEWLRLEGTALWPGQVPIEIIGMDGRVHKTGQIAGGAVRTFSLGELAPGAYLLRYRLAGEVGVLRFVRQ